MSQDHTMRFPLGDFQVTNTAIGQSPDSSATWSPAVVPGGVHESLLAAGRIPHPYFGSAETELRWIENCDWWYRSSFDLPPGFDSGASLRLLCHGLDTVVDLWLNGQKLGHHENMFRPAEFDVTGLVRSQNELVLRFSPPLEGLEPPSSFHDLRDKLAALFAQSRDDSAEGASEFVFEDRGRATLRRKPIFSWGWDFAPRLPSIGIWRPIELIRTQPVTLSGYHVQTLGVDRKTSSAELMVTVEVMVSEAAPNLAAIIMLSSPDGRQIMQRISVPGTVGLHEASVRVVVEEASLWWTHDLGDPSLYNFEVVLLRDSNPVDLGTAKVGIRTIYLDRSADTTDDGQTFRFVLNGEPVFARGAAYLPDSMFVGSLDHDRQRSLIYMARDAGMNMLRLWGGGLYEQDTFYEACDEAGVLVWQDFMFACIDYPSDDPTLYKEVALEAEYQVRRLRNHPCLALWAGNNEVHLLHEGAYRSREPGNWGYGFFHQLLPDVVARHSPGAEYWPGSPYGEIDPRGVNGVSDGDRHAWEVWHGIDFGVGDPEQYPNRGEAMHFHRYAKDNGRFISEFGILSAPARSTLERWLPPDQLTLESPGFLARVKDSPKDKVLPLLEIETGVPTDLDSYIQATMAVQAEGLKFGIEHYRQMQPHNSGTLIWQLNDVWPGISWSIIDHSLLPKVSYYFVKRAFSSAIASFRYDNGELGLWVSNSGREGLEDDLVVEILSLTTGQLVAEHRLRVTADPWSSRCVWMSSVEGPLFDKVAMVHSAKQVFPANRFFFAPIKDLPLTSPQLAMTITQPNGDAQAVVTVSASSYAYLVQLSSSDSEVRFSDNCFDVSPLRDVTVNVRSLGSTIDPGDISLSAYIQSC